MDIKSILFFPKGKIYISLMFVVTSVVLAMNLKDPTSVKKHLLKSGLQKEISLLESKLYLEFCLRRVVERENCIFSKPFFKLKKDNFVFESSRTKNIGSLIEGLGQKFSTTKHYNEFFQKLYRGADVIKELPSYRSFQLALKKRQAELAKKTDLNYFLTKQNQSPFSYFLALFSTEGKMNFFVFLFSLCLLSVLLEKRYGFWILLILLTSLILLRFYLLTLSQDSMAVILGGGFLVCSLSGLFITGLWNVYHRINDFIFRVGSIGIVILLINLASIQFSYTSVVPARGHLFSFFAGSILGLILNQFKFFKMGFYSKGDFLEWSELHQEKDLFALLNKSQRLLRSNQNNAFFKDFYLTKISEGIQAGTNQKDFYGHFRALFPYLGGKSTEKLIHLLNLLKFEIDLLPILRFLPEKQLSLLHQNQYLSSQWGISLKMIHMAVTQNLNKKSSLSSELYQIRKEELEIHSELILYFKHANIDEFSKDVFLNLERKYHA